MLDGGALVIGPDEADAPKAEPTDWEDAGNRLEPRDGMGRRGCVLCLSQKPSPPDKMAVSAKAKPLAPDAHVATPAVAAAKSRVITTNAGREECGFCGIANFLLGSWEYSQYPRAK